MAAKTSNLDENPEEMGLSQEDEAARNSLKFSSDSNDFEDLGGKPKRREQPEEAKNLREESNMDYGPESGDSEDEHANTIMI